MHMIEFDDAGIGCPILGEVYVARRIETNEIITGFIHVRDRNTRTLVDVLFGMLNELQPVEGEVIHLCRGRVFNGFESLLKSKGFSVERVQILGETNDLAEEAFLQELYTIGMPKTISLKGKDYAKFYQSVMVWYKALYQGSTLRKNPNKKRKPKERDYMMNQVSHHPNLLAILFGIKTKQETLV